MIASQITYNPGILGDEALARSFVVRHESLELILETLRENAASPAANRHLLMIGPRGIGKTMLVRRAAAAVRANVEYDAKWYPLVFGEESYPVSTPGEFWLEALFHLADQTGDPRLQKTFEEFRDERNDSRLRSGALGQLLDFSDREGKKILLVVENLNTLIGEQMDADSAWDLRHTLMNEPRLMLLGTATNRFDEVANIGHAWFEMFSVHQLLPLNLDECADLWRSITEEPLQRSPLRAVRILTGGNPRLITILAGFAANHSFRQLMEQLVHLIDDHTEYFRGHLEGLAVKERRVFVALLETWDPVSAAELGRQTRLSVNEVSALLGRLTVRGAVEVAQQKGRRKLYQAAERLYNIYYLMRRRGHPEGRVQAAVQFMISFYERDELVLRLADLATEACGLPEGTREDHYYAYCEVLRRMEDITAQVIGSTPPEFFRCADGDLLKGVGVSALLMNGFSLIQKEKFGEAGLVFERALQLDDKNPVGWIGVACSLLRDPSTHTRAEEAVRRAIELEESADLWHLLGWMIKIQDRLHEAERAFLKAIELKPSHAEAWSDLSLVYLGLQKLREAEEAARKATQIEPHKGKHWNNLGTVLWRLDQLSAAESAYRRAVDLASGNPSFWRDLGRLLSVIGPPEQAEAVWTEALKLHAKELSACSVQLLELRLARGVSRDEILKEAEDWVERNSEDALTLGAITAFIVKKRFTEAFPNAESWARKAAAIHHHAATAAVLAFVLAELKKWQEALECSRAMLDASGDEEQYRELSAALLIRAAAAGWAKEALTVLKASRGAGALEPLAVGLQIYVGEAPVVAKEILEIGQDVADRIRQHQAQHSENMEEKRID
ncbi:MAG TPA: tetratricopeptide repeat protein [Candidatus Angelobacter sp.]